LVVGSRKKEVVRKMIRAEEAEEASSALVCFTHSDASQSVK
jgi:hypothetical protein